MLLPSYSGLLHVLSPTHTDAVTASDLQKAGERLLQSNPSLCVIGDLQDVPSRREVESALFENGGLLTKKRNTLFSKLMQ